MTSAKSASTATFERDVLEASRDRPVLVDFWAPWCGPCQALGPVLDSLANEMGANLSVVKINTDEEPDIAGRFAIRSIPAVKLFRDGKVVAEFVGAQPLAQVRAFVAPYVESPADAARVAAHALADRGDWEGAINTLRAITGGEPVNSAAIVDLATVLAKAGKPDEAAIELARLTPAEQSEPATLAAHALVHFAGIATTNSGDGQSTQQRAARSILGGNVEAAAEALLTESGSSRAFATQTGKQELLQLFALVGPSDPRVAGWRRRLAALLN
jgi:putative thioredoxin